MNNFKTALLMLALIVLFVLVGQWFGGREGMIWAFVMGLIMNGIVYWFSDKIVLAMYGAKEVKRDDLPEVFSILEELTQSMNLPMPRVYVIDTPTPNAFATGRNPQHSAVAVTSGILNLLERRQLRGVLAHELSHIKNRDTLIAVISATVAGAIFTLARMAQWALIFGGGRRDRSSGGLGGLATLLLIIIAPLAALIIQLAISRSREYEADRSAGIATGDPLSLAEALRRLHEGVRRVPLNTHPTTAHLFIVNPLRGENLLTLFSTHPPIEERVRRLEDLAMQVRYNIPSIIR